MSKAKFVFHGLFPDVVESNNNSKEIAKILFDVEFNGAFHSHLLADIELIDHDGELEFEVRCKLPFTCNDFSSAAVQYYQYSLGHRELKLPIAGPKGPVLPHTM